MLTSIFSGLLTWAVVLYPAIVQGFGIFGSNKEYSVVIDAGSSSTKLLVSVFEKKSGLYKWYRIGLQWIFVNSILPKMISITNKENFVIVSLSFFGILMFSLIIVKPYFWMWNRLFIIFYYLLHPYFIQFNSVCIQVTWHLFLCYCSGVIHF